MSIFMKLRHLKTEDAPLMLEWMHDPSVVEKLQTDFSSKSLQDCQLFIENSITPTDIHLAIADENDEYMGTVSLKHILTPSAEFAITVRKSAMNRNIASWAMTEILSLARTNYQLSEIYWCVSPENKRALRFYDKNGYKRISADSISAPLHYTPEQINYYIWYKY